MDVARKFEEGDLIHPFPKHKRTAKSVPTEIIEYYEYNHSCKPSTEKMVKLKINGQFKFIQASALKSYYRW